VQIRVSGFFTILRGQRRAPQGVGQFPPVQERPHRRPGPGRSRDRQGAYRGPVAGKAGDCG